MPWYVAPFSLSLLLIGCLSLQGQTQQDLVSAGSSVFVKDNLVAWCIVPFDAKRRGPAARAEMIRRLGLEAVAYDWRAEHVASFEEEILQYRKHGITYFAFWSWHEAMGPLIEKYQIHPQIWQTNPSPTADSQAERVRLAAMDLRPLVTRCRQLGLQLGLYNHGGWGGAPENLVAVCRHLRQEHQAEHVGIVYNFHHGHADIDDFAQVLRVIKPYLLCLNLNGMADASAVEKAPDKWKILPLGEGKHELRMMRTILQQGYQGPIGILDHRPAIDTAESLVENLAGLRKLLEQLGDTAALKTYR